MNSRTLEMPISVSLLGQAIEPILHTLNKLGPDEFVKDTELLGIPGTDKVQVKFKIIKQQEVQVQVTDG